jgi:hypothetical protein
MAGIDGRKFEPWSVAEHVAQALQLSTWREKILQEERTYRWAHIFNKIEPNRATIQDCLGTLVSLTSGSVSPHYLFALTLAIWTYGYADALSALADEEITLWGGEDFDFPSWENEVPEPPRDPPDIEHREELIIPPLPPTLTDSMALPLPVANVEKEVYYADLTG